MDIADTDGMFAIPLPKHKSLKTAVVTSHRRRRKGERDPDPYGCHVPADPLGEVPPPPLTAKVMSMAAPEAVEGLPWPSATNTGPTSTVDTWWEGRHLAALLGKSHCVQLCVCWCVLKFILWIHSPSQEIVS